MRFRRIVGIVAACLAMSCGVVLAETVDRIVAVVNGDIILESELQHRMKAMEKVAPALKTADSATRAQAEREVLQQLIHQRLTDGEVAKLKITVSEADVNSAIERIKQQNNFTDAQFDYFVSQEGHTLDQFREQVKKEIERNRVVDRVLKSKTIITDEQVDAHLQTGAVSPVEQRRIAILLLKAGSDGETDSDVEKKARELHELLRGGADFASVVKENSQGPAVEDGGDIGYISTEELAAPIEKATRGLEPGQLSEVVPTPGGCYIFKVLDVRKQGTNIADPAMKEKIRRQLFQEEVGRKFQAWIKELEGKAFIQVFL